MRKQIDYKNFKVVVEAAHRQGVVHLEAGVLAVPLEAGALAVHREEAGVGSLSLKEDVLTNVSFRLRKSFFKINYQKFT